MLYRAEGSGGSGDEYGKAGIRLRSSGADVANWPGEWKEGNEIDLLPE